MFSEPGTFGFVSQRSIFGRSIGGGRRIDVDISGGNLEEVLGVALRATDRFAAAAAALRRGTALNPKDAGALSNLGNALRAVGDYEEAAAAHEASLTNRHDSHFGKGKQCASCHTVPPANDTTHIDNTTDLMDKANAAFGVKRSWSATFWGQVPDNILADYAPVA